MPEHSEMIHARDRDQLLESIFYGTDIAIFVVDVLPDGEFRFLGLNPAHERISGLKSEEIRGKRPEDLFPDVPRKVTRQIRKNFEECLEKGSSIEYEEMIPIRGNKLWWLTRLTPLKNRELEQVVYVASHDLRSPLVNIQGFTSVLEEDFQKLTDTLGKNRECRGKLSELESLIKDDIPESFGYIATSAKKMDNLIAGLLQLSRTGSVLLEKEDLDMNKLMEEVFSNFRYIAQKKNDIRLKKTELPSMQGDRAHVSQVFSNLIDNAIKYRHPDRPLTVQVAGGEDLSNVWYEVRDNGIGMETQYAEKIFELFYQLDPGKEGEGLGLTIVRRIVSRHNGSVKAYSSPGEGTVFHLEFSKNLNL